MKNARKSPGTLNSEVKIKSAKIEKVIFKIWEEKSKNTVGLKSFLATKKIEKKALKASEMIKKHEKIKG